MLFAGTLARAVHNRYRPSAEGVASTQRLFLCSRDWHALGTGPHHLCVGPPDLCRVDEQDGECQARRHHPACRTFRHLGTGVRLLTDGCLHGDAHALLRICLVTVIGASTLTAGTIKVIAEAAAAIVKILSVAISGRLGKRRFLAALGNHQVRLCPRTICCSVGRFPVAASSIALLRESVAVALMTDISPGHLRSKGFGFCQLLDTASVSATSLLAILLKWLKANNITAVFQFAVFLDFLAIVFMILGVQEPDWLPGPCGYALLLG